VRNFVPRFIHDQFRENRVSGRFSAVTLFLDISGFTSISDRLMDEGREGAEVLSDILGNVFDPAIDAIYNAGGFISGFEGDAFTAVFIFGDAAGERVVNAAWDIMAMFREHGRQETRFGDFVLEAKIGLSQGDVDWGILGLEGRKIWFFKGEAITGCNNAEKQCRPMEIILDDKLAGSPALELAGRLESRGPGYSVLRTFSSGPVSNLLQTSELSGDITRQFVPDKILAMPFVGELRRVVPVFISFQQSAQGFEHLNAFVSEVLQQAQRFGGYFRDIGFADKGNVMFVLFGAPIEYENSIEKALDFSLSLAQHFGIKIRVGITSGGAYAGITGNEKRCEYSVIGEVVNLASRFMELADWGETIVSRDIVKCTDDRYIFNDLGACKVKGKDQSVQYLSLQGAASKPKQGLYSRPMLGRISELEILQAFCEPLYQPPFSESGSFAGVVTVYGEAGIGKSRLLYELTQSQFPKAVCYVTQADNITRESMNPFVGFFRQYFNQHNELDEESRISAFEKRFSDLDVNLQAIGKPAHEVRQDLARSIHVFRMLIGLNADLAEDDQLDSKSHYEYILFTIKVFFKALSLIQPTIFVLEDLHWLDDDSINIMRVITRGMDDCPLLFLISSRLLDDGSLPSLGLDPEVKQHSLLLQELPIEVSGGIVKENIGYFPDDELLEFIADRTENNPFYVEQFALYLLENNLIGLNGEQYVLEQTEIGIPRGINALLTARIDRLSVELRETAQVASIFGRKFDEKVLQEMLFLQGEKPVEPGLERTAEDTLTAFSGLEVVELVSQLVQGQQEQIWSQLIDTEYMFRHHMLSESVYQMQLRSRLRNLHHLAATALEKLYSGDKALFVHLAYHYERAESIDKAAEYLKKAAVYAKESYHNADALDAYQRLLDNRRKAGCLPPDLEIEILLEQGEILQLLGDWARCQTVRERALQLAGSLGEQSLLANVSYALALILGKRGDIEKSLQFYDQALPLYRALQDEKGIALLMMGKGDIYLNQGDYAAAGVCYAESLHVAESLGDARVMSIAKGNIGVVYLYKGEHEEAIDLHREALQIASEVGYKQGMAKSLGNMGNAYREMGKYREAMKCYEKDMALSRQMGDKRGMAAGYNNMGMIHVDLEKLEAAKESFEKKMTFSAELGDRQGIATGACNLGFVCMHTGDFTGAERYYLQQLKIAEELGDRELVAMATGNIGWSCFLKGEAENSIQWLDRSLAIIEKLDIKYLQCETLLSRAKVSYSLHRFAEALSLSEKSRFIAEAVGRQSTIFDARVLGVTSEIRRSVQTRSPGFDPSEGLRLLEAMLAEAENDVQQASLHYELWKMQEIISKTTMVSYADIAENHKQKALALYENLWKKSLDIDYEKRVQELSD
jgi:tetratricopeptide (TPR) repeat protein/class 3 adenylate cyclase